jgi:plastocyanin
MKGFGTLLAIVMLASALALGACGKQSGGDTTSGGAGPLTTSIQMNATNFVLHAVQVKADAPVTLDNTVGGGGTHILCVGTGTGGTNTCLSSGNGPSALYGAGDTVTAGSTTNVTFANTGTYHVICTVHPGMFIDVKVIS